MSFLNIKDLDERDAIVKDYLGTVNRIKNRNLAERTDSIELQHYRDQEYEPIVASNKEMAEKITDELLLI